MHLLNILQSIPRFALCSSITVQAAPLGRNKEYNEDLIQFYKKNVCVQP